MGMTFGLGTDTMLNQYMVDAGQFKLIDMATNIERFNTSPAPPPGQAPIASAAYVDYTSSYLNRIMQRDVTNDNNTVFLFEYQALLRARMQQMITDLTAALTRDLDKAMNQTRTIWNQAGLPPRTSAQGYSSNAEDAGAARMAYNFLTGFSSAVATSDPLNTGAAYSGIDTFDSRTGAMVDKVSPDTQADAAFYGYDAITNGARSILRSFGTATIQQGAPEDDLSTAVIDNMIVAHQARNTLYQETGGGFNVAKNGWKFTDVETDRFNAQNIGFLNPTYGNPNADDNAAGLAQAGNMNDNDWDRPGTLLNTNDRYYDFNRTGNAKNEFERILYDTVYELDQRNLLRDIFRLSEKNSFFNDVQVASTSSLTTGSQIQASLLLNYIPRSTGNVLSGTATSAVVEGAYTPFAIGESISVAVGGNRITTIITNIQANVPAAGQFTYTFNPALSGPPDANSSLLTTRPDLGGRIQVVVDRFSAFYHSG